MRAVDTNVLVRILAQDDPDQGRAAPQFVEGGAWISHLVLAESTRVLATVFERTPKQIAAAIGQLLEHESLVLQEPEVVNLALGHFRKEPALAFSDCLILEIARKAGHLPLGTFDRALARLPECKRIAT
jgi:predicted nucleic-acid-binding protein